MYVSDHVGDSLNLCGSTDPRVMVLVLSFFSSEIITTRAFYRMLNTLEMVVYLAGVFYYTVTNFMNPFALYSPTWHVPNVLIIIVC